MQRVTHVSLVQKCLRVRRHRSSHVNESRDNKRGILYPFRCILREANVYPRAPPQSRKSLLSPNGTESERCFCSSPAPLRCPPTSPPPSFLFSRNRDSWASTKGFFSANCRVYPARPESLGTRFRLFWLLSFDPAMSLDSRRREDEREEKREEKRQGEETRTAKEFLRLSGR